MRGLAFIGEHLERDVFEGFPPCIKFYPQQTTVELIDIDINKIDLVFFVLFCVTFLRRVTFMDLWI